MYNMNYLVGVDKFFPDRPSGSARVAWDIAQIMRNQGHKVTVFCRKQKPEMADVSEFEGVHVIRFAFPKTFVLNPFKLHKQIFAGILNARKYLGHTKWDVVHTHIPLYGKILFELLGKGPRYIATVHSPIVMEQEIIWSAQGLPGRIKLWFGKGALKSLERGVLQRAWRIHTLSNFTKLCIDNYYGVGNKVTVIPHWCREDFVRRNPKADARKITGWPPDARILFSVRRLEWRMGLDIAIKAIVPLLQKHEDLYYVIVGTGSLAHNLKRLCVSLGVSDKIQFLGSVSDDLLKNCYEAADMFILPTRALECFGLPILEAFAYGLPVISTDAAAIPELMRPILPKCIVIAGNVELLRQKVEEYLNNQLELPSAEDVINYSKQNFGIKMITPKVIRFLEE
jgi:glycosyltransferase involved in cell wall biosynthesis